MQDTPHGQQAPDSDVAAWARAVAGAEAAASHSHGGSHGKGNEDKGDLLHAFGLAPERVVDPRDIPPLDLPPPPNWLTAPAEWYCREQVGFVPERASGSGFLGLDGSAGGGFGCSSCVHMAYTRMHYSIPVGVGVGYGKALLLPRLLLLCLRVTPDYARSELGARCSFPTMNNLSAACSWEPRARQILHQISGHLHHSACAFNLQKAYS